VTSDLLKTNGKVALPLQTEASQSHSIPEICAALGISRDIIPLRQRDAINRVITKESTA
jgi:hypothetical protein